MKSTAGYESSSSSGSNSNLSVTREIDNTIQITNEKITDPAYKKNQSMNGLIIF
jgi:hypothetical protein